MDAFSLRECTHEDAIRILRQTSQNVRLKVLRDELPLREEDVYEVIQVELVKKVGKVSFIYRMEELGARFYLGFEVGVTAFGSLGKMSFC